MSSSSSSDSSDDDDTKARIAFAVYTPVQQPKKQPAASRVGANTAVTGVASSQRSARQSWEEGRERAPTLSTAQLQGAKLLDRFINQTMVTVDVKLPVADDNVDEEEGCTLKLLQRSKQGLTAPGAAAAAAQRKPLRRRRHSSSSSSSSSSDEIERRVRSAGVVYTVTVPPAQVQHARAVNDSATQNILPDKVADTETPKHKRKRKHKKKKRKRGDTEAGTDVPGAALSDVKKKRERTTSSSNSADSD